MGKLFRKQQKQSGQEKRRGNKPKNTHKKPKAQSKIKEEDSAELSTNSHENIDINTLFTISDSDNKISVKTVADPTLNQSCNSNIDHKTDIIECHMASEELLALNKRIEELKKLKLKFGNRISRLNRFELMEIQIMGTWKEEGKRNHDIYNRNVYNKKLAELVEQFYLDDDHSRLSDDKLKFIIENGNKQKIRYLLYKTEIMYNRFVANFPQHQDISYTKFCKLKPFWVLPRPKKNKEMFYYSL